MAVHIMCLTVTGGLPLFTRKRGDSETLLPFSVVASLNGVHMFGKSQFMELKSTMTEEATLVWREFEESITLIGVASGMNQVLLNQLLTSVFRAMVLIVGVDELRNPRNVDILKRELRVCSPLIDHMMECVDPGERASLCTDLLGLTEVIMCQENHLLQTCLDTYAESSESLYGCLLIHGRIAVATPSWWQLDPDERKLLALCVSTDSSAAARDMPVFLPCKSPNVPFRLVSCTLMTGVEVCVLCGPTPSLADIEVLATQCWRTAVDLLRSAEQCHPRNFPSTIQLDTGIMGVLLIDESSGKYMVSRNQSTVPRKEMSSLSSAHRLDVLRTFYYQISSTLLHTQSVLETYWCSEYHKCHALRQGGNLLCVLYVSAIPTHTLRIITQRTAKLLTFDKQLCWSID